MKTTTKKNKLSSRTVFTFKNVKSLAPSTTTEPTTTMLTTTVTGII